MPNTHDIRDVVRVTGTFTDAASNAADPSYVVLRVRDPALAKYSYAYGVTLQGAWNAETNTPALADGTGTAGDYYTVSVAGSTDFGNGSITFTTSDWVIYDGARWVKLENASTAAITRSATGVYFFDLKIRSQEGRWYYRFEGENVNDAGEETYFAISPSKFY